MRATLWASASGSPPDGASIACAAVGISPWMRGVGDPHVRRERCRDLRVERWLRGLPSKAADARLGGGHDVRAAGDAIAVAVVGIGEREDRRIVDRLDQAATDQLWSDAQRHP